MKNYFQVFLAILIFVQPIFSAASETNNLANVEAAIDVNKVNLDDIQISGEQELALLNTIRARVQMYMQVNKNLAEEILSCFNRTNTSERCEKRMAHVRELIRVRYPRMRRSLLLYNMMSSSTMGIFVDYMKIHSQAPNNPKKYTPFPWSFEKGVVTTDNPLQGWITDNPLTGWTTSMKIEHPDFEVSDYKEALFGTNYGLFEKILEIQHVSIFSLPMISKSEQTNIPKNFSEYFKFMCRDGMDQPQYPKNLINKSYCEKLKIYWDDKKNDGSFYLYLDHRGMSKEEEMKMRQSVFPSFYLNDMRVQYAKVILEDYYTYVTTHPFLALVRSSTPTDAEIVKAFEKIVVSAYKNVDAFRKKFPKPFESTDLNNNDRLIIMDYGPVVEHAIAHPSTEMKAAGDDSVYALGVQKLSRARAMQQLKRAGRNILAIIGLNVACMLPWGRVFKGATLFKAGGLFKPLCISSITLPVGAFFIQESYSEYARTFHELFGVPLGYVNGDERLDDDLDTGERTLNEMSNLKSAEMFLLIDIVTAPMGSGMAMQKLTASGIRLTVKQKSIVAKAIEAYRFAPMMP